MRKILAATFVSLDGIMQAPGGPDEDTELNFRLGGWTFPFFDAALGASMGELFGQPFDLLLGRKTYDIFAAYWPRAAPDDPIGGVFNRVVKYVATHSRAPLDWENSRSLGDDIVATLTGLKAGEGPTLLIQGSGDLIQTLLAHGLIDEFRLMIFPVVLGRGKRLFASGAIPAALKLTASQSYPTGVITATYVPDGEVRTGSFALEE